MQETEQMEHNVTNSNFQIQYDSPHANKILSNQICLQIQIFNIRNAITTFKQWKPISNPIILHLIKTWKPMSNLIILHFGKNYHKKLHISQNFMGLCCNSFYQIWPVDCSQTEKHSRILSYRTAKVQAPIAKYIYI